MKIFSRKKLWGAKRKTASLAILGLVSAFLPVMSSSPVSAAGIGCPGAVFGGVCGTDILQHAAVYGEAASPNGTPWYGGFQVHGAELMDPANGIIGFCVEPGAPIPNGFSGGHSTVTNPDLAYYLWSAQVAASSYTDQQLAAFRLIALNRALGWDLFDMASSSPDMQQAINLAKIFGQPGTALTGPWSGALSWPNGVPTSIGQSEVAVVHMTAANGLPLQFIRPTLTSGGVFITNVSNGGLTDANGDLYFTVTPVATSWGFSYSGDGPAATYERWDNGSSQDTVSLTPGGTPWSTGILATATGPETVVSIHKNSTNPAVPAGAGFTFEVWVDSNNSPGDGPLSDGYDQGPFTGTTDANGNVNINISALNAPHWKKVMETGWPTNFTGPAPQQEGVIDPGESQSFTFDDAPLAENFQLIKHSDNTRVTDLSGAVFDLYYDADNNGSYETGPVASRTTLADGTTLVVNGVQPGNWRAVETTPLPGHSIMAPFDFTVSSDASNATQVFNVTNNEIAKTLRIIKVDGDNTSVKLPGAEFDVREDVDGDPATGVGGAEGNPVHVVTGANGTIDVALAHSGNFTVTETKPPTGYLFPEQRMQNVTIPVTASATVEVTFKNVKPTVTTSAQDQIVTPGSTVYDNSVWAGMGPQDTGSLDNKLYGPFPIGYTIGAQDCTAEKLIGAVTKNVVGPGSGKSDGVDVGSEIGKYAWVETYTSTVPGVTASVTGKCGEVTEIFIVADVSTQIRQEPVTADGKAVFTDDMTIVGFPANTKLMVTLPMYCGFESQEEVDGLTSPPADKLHTTKEFEITTGDVDGTYTFNTGKDYGVFFPVDNANGFCIFAETITAKNPYIPGGPDQTITHKFPDKLETAIIYSYGLHKVNRDNHNQSIPGGVYELFDKADPATVIGKGTTDADGRIVWAIDASVARTICTRETEAPAGWIKSTEISCVEVNGASFGHADVIVYESPTLKPPVKGTPHLSVTGADVAKLGGAGALLLLIGALSLIVIQRKKNDETDTSTELVS